ncbi:MAG: hypothetical protein LC650_04500 [Actinobacteria bacterium]|nr:hypothetical protein [Actinomycetota bacterium]
MAPEKRVRPYTDLEVQLTGENGNVFNLMGIVNRALKKAGHADEAARMVHEVTTEATDYHGALIIMGQYVTIK